MPCDWTHHLKQEWTLEQFQPEIDVDEIIGDLEEVMAESEKTLQHSQRIRSSKGGTAKQLAPMGAGRPKKVRTN